MNCLFPEKADKFIILLASVSSLASLVAWKIVFFFLNHLVQCVRAHCTTSMATQGIAGQDIEQVSFLLF